jgi:hypothetical protein
MRTDGERLTTFGFARLHKRGSAKRFGARAKDPAASGQIVRSQGYPRCGLGNRPANIGESNASVVRDDHPLAAEVMYDPPIA